MRNFTFKGLFLTAVFALLWSLTIQAAEDGLITKQITIKLKEAGTLPDRIDASKKYLITNLKLVGEINGTDWKMIREMAGSNYNGYSTEGKLSTLDLSEAKIVKGGDSYYSGDNCYTSNDEIGEYAFHDCSGLTSLTLPSSITSIGESAFRNCHGLTSLTLPAGITRIGSYAFEGCSGLTSLTLPAGITSISDYAFEGCSGLTSLNLPAGITSIGDYAFNGCRGLTSLTLPAGITSIGDYAFYGCDGLTSLTLPAGITSIGDNAFDGSQGLTSINLPSSITSIGRSAFFCCRDLTSVYVSWQFPIPTGSAFYGVDISKCTLYVPQGTEQDYWLSPGWGDFGKIVEYNPTGIDRVTTSNDAKELSRYSVNGLRLSAPAKGLNIVKYSDGSVKKIVVQ